jgi:hypothetical protein
MLFRNVANYFTCHSWGFRSGVADVPVLEYYAASLSNWFATFRQHVVSSWSKVEMTLYYSPVDMGNIPEDINLKQRLYKELISHIIFGIKVGALSFFPSPYLENLFLHRHFGCLMNFTLVTKYIIFLVERRDPIVSRRCAKFFT